MNFRAIVFTFFCTFTIALNAQSHSENEETINKSCQYTQSDNKGKLYLHIAFPLINSFRIIPENEGAKVNTGLTGITYGLGYYYSKNQFVHFGGSQAITAQFRNGEYGQISSTHISLSNNHQIKRFSIGYGLSYAIDNTWIYANWKVINFRTPEENIRKSHSAFGLIFPAHFQIGNSFNVGVVYRPTFYRPTLTDKFVYEHLISIDLAWKIMMGNINNRNK